VSGISWWLADRVSLLLESDERKTVRGDLAESGESGWQALAGMLGLVARRQAALWCDWHPWFALMLATQMGLQLTRLVARGAHTSAIYLWMYVDNWRFADVGNSGFWHLMAHESGQFLWPFLLIMVGGLAMGWVIGMGARRNTAVAGGLFWLIMAVANILDIPRGPYGVQHEVFELTFYRTIYPLIVHTAFFLLPSVWGMRWGRKFWTAVVNDLSVGTKN
jgi:hypothetical protein